MTAAKRSLVCALAAVLSNANQAQAQALPHDPSPPKDCSLLQDPDRSPSVWRHLRWSVGSTERNGQRLAAANLGWNLWTREALCQREVFFESEILYARTALAIRIDIEYDVQDAGLSAYRPALEFSTGASDWGWVAFAVSAGPKFDHRGSAASGTVGVIYIGIEMGLRLDQGIDYQDRTMSVYIGLTDLHLHLKSIFADYQPS